MTKSAESVISFACAFAGKSIQQDSGDMDSKETKIVKKSTKTNYIVKQSAVAGALAASASILINKLSSKTTNTKDMIVKSVLITPIINLLL